MKKLISVILAIMLLFAVSVTAFAADDTQRALPFENSQFYDYGEYTLHYRVFEPAGKVKNQIILIHGFGLSGISFDGLTEEYVQAGYRVVLVDMPNFGYSSRETKSTEFVDRETLTYELMCSINDKNWIVGGHSMGGGIAMNIATDHPKKVSGLVLFAPQTSTELDETTAKFMRADVMTKSFGAIIKLASKVDFLIKIMVLASFSDLEFTKNYNVRRVSDPLGIDGTGGGISIMSSHARGTDHEKFSQLKMPVVIVTCTNDNIASKPNLKTTLDNAPEGTVVEEFTEGGHMMMEYNPAHAAEVTLPVMAEM